MTQLSRRQWLRTAGITGAFSLLGGAQLAQAAPKRMPSLPKGTIEVERIRLSSNENPYGPSEKVRRAMTEAFDRACRYPFGYSDNLYKMIAEKEGVTTDHLVVTAGSTEGLRIAGLLYGMEGGEIVAARPTFLALMSYAEKYGAAVHWVPVDDELRHDPEAMDRRITARTSLMYICNPNNPTGTILPPDQLRDFVTSVSKRTMAFVDEAYFDYITEPHYPSMVDLVKAEQNVIVAKTFSKVYGLAGLRIGYLVARPDIARRLRDHIVAFTNVLALAAAEAALKDDEFYQFSLKKNQEAKEMIYATLDELELPYARSHTNFVFFESGRDIGKLIGQMQQQGVQIGRPFPPLTKHCRISTGTIEQTRKFCEGLKNVLS
jgi:histidinol-phosphate aminotransferase